MFHRSRLRHERGASLAIVALFMAVLSLFTVLGTNVGLMMYQRTKLQAAADAAALAGAWSLDFGDAEAIAAAKQYALSNGYTLLDPDVTVVNSSLVRVKLTQSVGFVLGDLLANKSVTVGASSTAQFQVPSRGLRPLGFPYKPSFEYGVPYVIKQSDTGIDGVVLSLDGTGASSFEETFKYGSKNVYHVNDVVGKKTNGGDSMSGPTTRAFKFLYNKDPQGTYAAARQNPDNNPRVVTVALVSPIETDKKSVRIERFARFFLVSEKNGDITTYFIDMFPVGADRPGTKYHAQLKLVL